MCSDERCPHSDLCFAKAHVAADQTIHDLGRAHVLSNSLYCGGLIRRFLEGESFAKALPFMGVQGVSVSCARFSSRVDLEKLSRDICGSLLCFFSCLIPLITSEPMEWCGVGIAGGIATDQVQRPHRHVKFVVFRILQQQELSIVPLYLQYL